MSQPESCQPTSSPSSPARTALSGASTPLRLYFWLSIALMVAGGIGLRISVLRGPMVSDDWDHYAMAKGWYPISRSPLDFFNFVRADRGELPALLQSGRMPWWSDHRLRLSFMRPLSSLLTYVDFAWFDAAHQPWRAHLESLLVWAAGVIALAGLLARLLPLSVTLIACLLYATDDAHSVPVAWNANRAELIAFVLSVGALWAHVAWDEQRAKSTRLLAIALTWLAIFAGGEHALALFAYFVAYTLIAARGSWRERWTNFLPLLVPVMLYVALHVALGYGAAGSSFYTDPVSDPGRYFQRFPVTLSLLLGDLVFGYAADWHFTPPPWYFALYTAHVVPDSWLAPAHIYRFQLLLGLGAGLVITLALVRLFRKRVDPSAIPLRWLLVGSLASLPALCGVFAMSRLTVTPALGVHALLAWCVVAAYRRVRGAGAFTLRIAAAVLLIAIASVHGLYAAMRSRGDCSAYALLAQLDDYWTRLGDVDGPEVGGRHVFVISAQDLPTQYSLPFVRLLHGLRPPLSSQMLLPTQLAPVDIRRVAPNVLELSSANPEGFGGFRNSSYRLESDDFHVGEHVVAPNVNVEVVTVEHGIPTLLRFVFHDALDSEHYLFLYPQTEGLTRLALPDVGSSLRLAPPAWPGMMLARMLGK